MRFASFVCAAISAGAQLVSSWELPLPCTGICDNTHDPSLIRRDSDGSYWRFSTSNNISIHTAPELTGPWEYRGPAFPNCSSIDLPGRCDLWAPDVSRVGDQYVMYYSVSVLYSQTSAIGVATSSDLETWTDLGSSGVESRPGLLFNAIDGQLSSDCNDNYFLQFGSYWTGLYNVAIPPPPSKIVLEETQLNHLAENHTNVDWIEGSFVYPFGGFYYLFFSSGICCGYDVSLPAPGEEYKIMVCRADSPVGPFIDEKGVPCLDSGGTQIYGSHDFVYGPGGQGVYFVPEIGSLLYYHYVDTRIGYADSQKRLGIQKIDFTSGWPRL